MGHHVQPEFDPPLEDLLTDRAGVHLAERGRGGERNKSGGLERGRAVPSPRRLTRDPFGKQVGGQQNDKVGALEVF